MLPARTIFQPICLCIVPALMLVGCASHAPLPRADASSLEQRLFDLERRVGKLESRSEVEHPYRSKAEIQAHIKALEEERQTLLSRYTAQHPAIRDIDRRLAILDNQLKRLE